MYLIMEKSKLIKALFSLSIDEMKTFRDFFHSPFFNKNQKVIQLGDFIIDHFLYKEAALPEKEKIYTQLFGSPFRELRMNNIISDLYALLLEFLSITTYQERPLSQQQHQMEMLISRELHFQQKSTLKKYQKSIASSSYQNYQHFMHEHLFHEIQDQALISNDQRAYSEHLQLKDQKLDLYYFSNKLRIACDMYSRNMVIKAGYESQYLDELLLRYSANKEQFSCIPSIKVYYDILQMLQQQDSNAYYYIVKKSVEQFSAFFPDSELNTIYSYILNFCVKQINSGNTSFYKEIHETYKTLLDKALIFQNGFLSQWHYTNINVSALRLAEFDWAEAFLQKYKSKLLPDQSFNVFTYNLTSFYFAQKDYEKTLALLNEVEFTDPFYHAAAKIIQLKVYYELEETEAFYSLTEAFRQFVKRNRSFSSYQKSSNLNFIKATTWVYKWKINQQWNKKADSKHNQLILKNKINKLSPLGNRAWVESKVA